MKTKTQIYRCSSHDLGRGLRSTDIEEAAWQFAKRLAKRDYPDQPRVDRVDEIGSGRFRCAIGRGYGRSDFRGHEETLEIESV